MSFFHRFQSVFCFAFACLLLGHVLGCAGGSRGSGGQEFGGSVFDAGGKGISGVEVILASTGDSVVTDDQGHFNFEVDPQSGPVQFLLQSPTFSGSVTTNAIPSGATVVTLQFTVNSGSTTNISVQVHVAEISPSPSPRPTATADDHGGNSGSGSGSGEPSLTPTPTPSGDDSGSSSGGSSSGSSGSSSSSGSSGSSGGSSSSGSSSTGSSSGGSTTSGGSSTGGSSSGSTGGQQTVEAEGNISSLSQNAVVVLGKTFVPTGTTEYRGKNGAVVTLSAFHVGDKVRARGIQSGADVLLQKLEMR